MGDLLARLVLRSPALVLLGVVGACAFAVTQIVDFSTGQPRLRLDTSLSSILSPEDPDRAFYERVREIFGADDSLLLALRVDEGTGGVFQTAALERLVAITEALEAHESVERVVSLANADDIRSEDATLRVTPFLDESPDGPEALDELRDRIDGNPVWSGNLVSRDGNSASISVRLLPVADADFLAEGIDEQLLALARQTEGPGEIALTGGPHVRAETSRLLRSDLARVIPLIILSMAVVATLAYRSPVVAAVSIATTLVALVWALGVIAASGRSLNTITVALPPLVLIVGFAYVIHLVAAVRSIPGERHARVRQALRETTLPIVLAGVTTVAGFLALNFTGLAAVREFGTFCAIGISATLIASLTFAPACLVLWPPRASSSDDALSRFFARFADVAGQRGTEILLAGLLVVPLAIWGIGRIHVGTGMVSSFPADSPTAAHFDQIAASLEGASMLSVIVEADGRAGNFEQAKNLQAIADLTEWIETQAEVGGTTSLVDLVRVLNRGFREDAPDTLRIPTEPGLIAQLLLLGPTEDIADFVDADLQTTHVLVRSAAKGSDEIGGLARRIEAHMAETLPSGLVGRVTGNTLLLSRTVDRIAADQAGSLAWAFGSIFVVLSLLFMSPRMGFMALLPNVLPVVFYFGLLGWTGTTLNLTTGIVACLVLGIAVDDTMHFMVHFNEASRKLTDERGGARAALAAVGQPVSYTSLALVLGFLGCTAAQLQSLAEFGAMAAATLAFAWLVDVTFTPALAARMRVVTLWDLLSRDLGDEPHRTIPLFEGLSRTQARIACLMMRIQRFDAGESVVRKGDPGDEFFVVLDGDLEARVPDDSGGLVLRKLHRGDLVGEVALFEGARSADVIASTDARLLAAGGDDLHGLQRRYPRIAARVYANLSRVLASRLSDVTSRLVE